MEVSHLLERLFSNDSVRQHSTRRLREQSGGLHFIAFMIVKILTFVFEKVLLPLAQMMFQLPDFFYERDKVGPDGKFLDSDGNVLEDQNDPTVRVKEKKFRTKFGFIPAPMYTPESDGKGYFWRYLKYCFKISWGLVVGMLGGIYLVLGGMIYMVAKVFKDFADKPSGISEKYTEKKK